MPTITLCATAVEVNEEGFMTDPEQWSETICVELATNIGVEMTDAHWDVIQFLRADYSEQGETATLRRVTQVSGTPTKELFKLFPKKPAKKMAYVAGLPKPHGCV